MQMFIKQFHSDKYTIKAEMENNSDLVSFDRCFVINTPGVLPKSFKIRDDRVYTKVKLRRYENVLHRVECTGEVSFRGLCRFMPSVFDVREVKRMNEREFIKENFIQIVGLSEEVIGREKAEEILRGKIDN